jgi:hypothetical protein
MKELSTTESCVLSLEKKPDWKKATIKAVKMQKTFKQIYDLKSAGSKVTTRIALQTWAETYECKSSHIQSHKISSN